TDWNGSWARHVQATMRLRVVVVSVVGVAMIVAGGLAGCASGGPGGGGPGAPGGGSPSVDGRTFLSEEVTGATLVPGTQISLRFADGQVQANAGCNHLSAPYAWDGTTLVVTGMAGTEMGCDPTLHAQDEWLAELLTSRPDVSIDGDTLTISGKDVTVRLVDREVADPDRPLVGTRWVVDSIIDGESVSTVPGDAEAYFVFEGTDSGGYRVSGLSGCNQFHADVTVGEETITFSRVGTTDMACSGPSGALEQAVSTLFDGRPVAYTIEARR